MSTFPVIPLEVGARVAPRRTSLGQRLVNAIALANRRVLIVGVNYWPETAGIGPYTTGLAEHLAATGASVTVVTAVPHYPAWKVAPAYERGGPHTETRKGVTIRRVRPRMPDQMTAASRAAFEASFALKAHTVAADMKADAVIGVVPSLAGAGLGAWIAHRRRIPY